uniref:Alkylated DNA repair protein AlkB homologue 8 N-terminal domain-containing protein n=1 Tax=Anguilla anguilla TaxID=7936 RepID=A0A0E9RQX8_ANGAN
MFTWQAHVDSLCSRLQQRLYFLRRLRVYGLNGLTRNLCICSTRQSWRA